MRVLHRTAFPVLAFVLGLLGTASSAQEADKRDSAGPERSEAAHPRDRFSTTPQLVTPGLGGDAPADETIQSGDRTRELDWPSTDSWRNDP
jgi:hypothetical protein